MRSIFKILASIILLASCQTPKSQNNIIIKLEPDEKIWSGTITEGEKMPFATNYHFDFYNDNAGNQIQPLLLSNKGLYVWSEEPYRFDIKNDQLIISKNLGEIIHGRSGTTLRDARNYASEKFFPPSGNLPDESLFSKPQYNTWIELTYNQNQTDVLKYAHSIIENNFPPGVIMIDDTWQEDYGLWEFHPGRFPNPKQMMDELHSMGFKVMLWICPFVSPDQTLIAREIMKGKGFLMNKATETTTWATAKDPEIVKWWNGYSAVLDFTNPAAVKWFDDNLDRLVTKYGVDGFKFDAGDPKYYPITALSKEHASPNDHSLLFARFGLRFPLNEYRACWKMAGQPLAQRLRDKYHNWEDMKKLIPHMLAEGLAGYTFCCPDMIGGGDFVSFIGLNTYDEELVVRSAQCHALMPMMQFSVAPWRILNKVNLDAVKKAVSLRLEFTPLILELAHKSATTGEPIMASLEYYFPGKGYEDIIDEFMLGENILVAPMTNQGYTREVILPEGNWTSDDNKAYQGGKTYSIEVPIDRIPWFKKQ